MPPELLGSHVAAPTAHTTGRTHSLDFRAATAIFGHLGIEWDLCSTSAADRERLARWIAVHTEHRDLLATGRVVRSDHGGDALWTYGVLSDDRSRALFAVVAMTTAPQAVPGRVTLPGLDPSATYEVSRLGPEPAYGSISAGWPADDAAVLVSGAVLGVVGIALPSLLPESAVVLGVHRV